MPYAKQRGGLFIATLNSIVDKSLNLRPLSYADPQLNMYKEGLAHGGLPSNLACEKIPGMGHMRWGIFLKPDARSIKKGQFIGFYTGTVELVDDETYSDGSYIFNMLSPDEIEEPISIKIFDEI